MEEVIPVDRRGEAGALARKLAKSGTAAIMSSRSTMIGIKRLWRLTRTPRKMSVVDFQLQWEWI